MEKNKYVNFATCDSFRWSRSHICLYAVCMVCFDDDVLSCWDLVLWRCISVTESMLHQSYLWMKLTRSVRLVLKVALEVCTTVILMFQLSCLLVLIITI